MIRYRISVSGIALFAALITFFGGPLRAASPSGASRDARTTPRYFPQASRSLKPSVSSGDVVAVNSASFLPGVSPGGLITIFGHDLSDVSGAVVAQSDPLPYELANVSVQINGTDAPIFSVVYNGSEDQISVQVPYSTATGPSAAVIDVFDYGVSVGTTIADSYDEDPGIFVYGQNDAVALLYPDYSLISPNNGAFPGDYLIVYTTGLGPLSLDLRDGYGAPSDPLAYTQDPFEVSVNGESCRVFFAGLAPGFVGLYQLNIQLPADLPQGDLQLQITSPYASSNVAIVPVI